MFLRKKETRPANTCVDQLWNDIGLSIAELKSIVGNRNEIMEFEFAPNKQGLPLASSRCYVF